ncbi:Signal recognition particle receptor subunit beta, partial [Linum perenne]
HKEAFTDRNSRLPKTHISSDSPATSRAISRLLLPVSQLELPFCPIKTDSCLSMEGVEQWKKEAEQWIQQGVEYVRQVPEVQQAIEYASQVPAIQQGIEYVNRIPPVQLYSAAAVLVFTTLLLILVRLFKRPKSNTIVLSGLSGSGKTILFYQGHKVKPVHLVDVPGHARLRPKLDEFLPEAAGIVFVVDALEFLPNLRGVSEYLYDILTKASVVKKKVPVLICCNKTEKVTAHTKDFICKQLEKEIDKLRASRSAVSDADVANDHTLGTPGKPFSFSQCTNKVSIGEASGLTGKITEVEQFIREHVRP